MTALGIIEDLKLTCCILATVLRLRVTTSKVLLYVHPNTVLYAVHIERNDSAAVQRKTRQNTNRFSADAISAGSSPAGRCP